MAPTRAGVLVADPSGTDERLLPWAQAATWVQAREREADVRWVWPDTASLYPRLLSAGVRVARCHDLRLCHTILALATAQPWQAPAWLTAPAEPAAPSLLDDLTPDDAPSLREVSAEFDRQLSLNESILRTKVMRAAA